MAARAATPNRNRALPPGLLCLLLILRAAALTDTGEEEEDCSQPGIGCIIRKNDCFDSSWLSPSEWTPTIPASMAASVVIGVNGRGHRVPFLQINWTINMDYSIVALQGVQILLVDVQTNGNDCRLLKFTNQFGSQWNPESRQPWQFSYNKFQVKPGLRYHVTVQHLPKLEKPDKLTDSNSRSMEVEVPGCADEQIMQTDSCCDLGLCWSPNISLTSSGRNLTVEFNRRFGADRYGIEVKLEILHIKDYQYIDAEERSPAKRLSVTFVSIGGQEDCLYKVSVWPSMAPCGSDCIRQYYSPVCPTETPPPPGPLGRWYLWFIAALFTIVLSAALAIHYKDFLCRSEMKRPPSPPPSPPPPLCMKKLVWLVYSADNPLYVSAVIGLADFLRVAWGLDVVLDRHHVHEIGFKGAMTWLGLQKSKIERNNGTILILCSRGAQEKWEAMKEGQKQRVTLREDRDNPIGDLFTPALTLILPDLQRSLAYDRYVVAYFDDLSSVDDIPSPFDYLPKYALTEHLQDLFFRIQRREQHQPHVELSVCQEDHPTYSLLVRAAGRCRDWQERHVDWFEKECSPCPYEDEDEGQIWEDAEHDITRVTPVIVSPEVDISMVEPLLTIPGPSMVLDPVICDGAPCSQLEPSLFEPTSMVTMTQPLLQEETSPNIFIQDLSLVEPDFDFGLCGHILQPDFYPQTELDDQSIEALMETQRRLLFGNVPNNQDDFISNLISDPPEMEELPPNFLPPVQFVTPEMDPFISVPDEGVRPVTDLGYDTMDTHPPGLEALKKEAMRLLLQNGDMRHMNQV